MYRDVYVKPYNRAGPWIVGLFVGYEIFNNKRKLSKVKYYNLKKFKKIFKKIKFRIFFHR